MSTSVQSFFAVACALSMNALAQSLPPSAPPAPTPASTQQRNDYSTPETWLCRPGREDACAVDLSTTIISADGKLKRESFEANRSAPIDCFYVYPTVSLDRTLNSDMQAGPEERGVIHQQFARFAQQCKVYAPLYRQVTLAGLRAFLAGKLTGIDRELAYNDVLDAWNYYLERDNKGRGVVLIGHSQGAGVLTDLIRKEIDGKPLQDRIVSALLLGTNVAVPKDKDRGGAFQNMPLCKSATQTGCVISYAAFRDTMPPSPSSRFGNVEGENMRAACVNPATLAGGNGELHAYLSAGGRYIVSSAREPAAWVASGAKIETPFVSVPGLLTAECVDGDASSYLAVKVHGNPADPRTDDIVGDIIVNGEVQKDWGLHLIDVNLAMGNLVDIVGRQAKAYGR